MTKTMIIALLVSVLLIGSSIASLVVEPVQPSKTRNVVAGGASVQVPKNLPVEIKKGTTLSGSVTLGSKDECDVTFDRFTGIYWDSRPLSGLALLPTPAYNPVSEKTGAAVELGNGGSARSRIIKLSAEKPCGKIVEETLNIIDLYCSTSKTHYAIVGMQDPFMTQQKVVEIAQSLKCS